MDGMLNTALSFAQHMLGERGEFYPYGVKLTEDGATTMVAGDPATGEDQPSSTEVLATIYAGLRSERGSIRAAVVVSDVRIDSPASDAIQVEIEHRDGIALAVVLPYSREHSGSGITYGDLRAALGEHRVWSKE